MDDDTIETKVCPQCGQVLFADMDVCYGCLHSFAREGGPAVGQAIAGSGGTPRHLGGGQRNPWEDQGFLDVDEPEGLGEGCGETGAGFDAAVAPGSPDGAALPARPAEMPAAEPLSACEEATSPELEPLEPDLTTMLALVPPALALRLQTSAVDVVVPLPAEGLSIGRAPDNDVVLHSKAVSRRHMRVEPSAAGATLLDLGATNPVLYRGRVAPAELRLTAGDTVDVCGTVMTLVEVGGAA